MTDPQTSILINRLDRACRWWKKLAIGALAALFLVILIGVVITVSQRQQIRAEHERAEEALREAEAQRDQAQWALYASRIALAERERSQSEPEQ